MAKQKSIIKIQGSIDDMTFYQMNGSNFVKKKSTGITKERINNDPRFERTKENNQEFAGATAAAAGIRLGFAEISDFFDNMLSVRLAGVCRKVISKDTGKRGQRPFLPAIDKEGLQTFVLNKSSSLDTIFKAPYTISVVTGRYNAVLTVPDFNPAMQIVAPSGATTFRIFFQISAVSSYEYDLLTQKYVPAFPDYNGKHALVTSAYFPLNSTTITLPPLTALLTDVEELPEPMVLLVCAGIQFYQTIGDFNYPLTSRNAMKIVSVN